jgi:hypothetical protein
LAKYLGITKIKFVDCSEAFEHLNLLCIKNAGIKTKFIILLDEISWMGVRKPDFAGFLKDAWDAQIPLDDIEQIGPYFQSLTKARAGLQLDCLIQGKKGLLHLFEFKTCLKIGIEAEKEVIRKSTLLKIHRGFSMRHYLVYSGELSDDLYHSDFFD